MEIPLELNLKRVALGCSVMLCVAGTLCMILVAVCVIMALQQEFRELNDEQGKEFSESRSGIAVPVGADGVVDDVGSVREVPAVAPVLWVPDFRTSTGIADQPKR